MGVGVDGGYQLEDRYRAVDGSVYLTGLQALVRVLLDRRRADVASGLHTAGFVSGYRGSPLAAYDLALDAARDELTAHHVHFEPGVNEDLAATAVWGTQQLHLVGGARYDGVFGVWYGKGPGVDRSGDALKHANYAGTAARGGVLALAGDDHGAKSSTLAHQSEPALIAAAIPVLAPSSVQEFLDHGALGIALSRFSGSWVGMSCVTDTVESAGTVDVGADRLEIRRPDDFEIPPGGLNIRWDVPALAAEQLVYEHRLPAAQAFARANRIDRVVLGDRDARLGLVTTGKAHLDVLEALTLLGIDRERAERIGLAVFKVAMPWPLEPVAIEQFAAGLDEIFVVEEKRPIVEDQLARLLYRVPDRPRLLGKHDADGRPALPQTGELTPGLVARTLARWLARSTGDPELIRRAEHLTSAEAASNPPGTPIPVRLPSFCAGCPHNLSTKVPAGSVALGGIGCHGMVLAMPERRTLALSHMGGEGAAWIGLQHFTDVDHIFQNLGDGTYFHSGLLAVRAAVAAKASITFKILVNGAIAMTGGQQIEGEPLLDGSITAPAVARQLVAEGVERVVVVSDDPDRYPSGSFPPGVDVEERHQLDAVQRSLRDVRAVTAIVYDQTCAAERRRLRKRGRLPVSDRRVFVNELVCDGCGDCNTQSNCIAVAPLETVFGRKRVIDQSACNQDFTCLDGDCPSFVTVTGARLRGSSTPRVREVADAGGLPEPARAPISGTGNILVAGIGGSGVVTIGAILGVAAHLEGLHCTVLDVTGLAQKNGPVTSHVRIAARRDQLASSRIPDRGADLLIACDPVVGAAPTTVAKIAAGRTAVLLDEAVAPTADFANDPDLDLSSGPLRDVLRSAAGEDAFASIPATRLARSRYGDGLLANLLMLGAAYQRGALPMTAASIEQAIVLNGRAVEANLDAFTCGRRYTLDPDGVSARSDERSAGRAEPAPSLPELLELFGRELTSYQDRAYALRFRRLVDRVAAAEAIVDPGSTTLAETFARSWFKLMAIKDEYEVARLYADGRLRAALDETFEGNYRVNVHLAPQILNRRDQRSGRARKYAFGPWVMPVLSVLARGKRIRGSALDVFGRTEHRRHERMLRDDFERIGIELADSLRPDNLDVAHEIAGAPMQVRGYGTVKDASIDHYETHLRELMHGWRSQEAWT